MAALAELDTSLEALRSLKAPGVTKSRIASITTICLENIKSESVLVQKMFTHFKRSPSTHKLGVMYVMDSVVRQWIEKAGVSGQDVSNSSNPDGTFAAGVRRITELLPVLMNDLVQNAPDDQKEKILKLIDIWERGSIFPKVVLAEYKKKLTDRPPKSSASAAPSGQDMPPFTITPAPHVAQSQAAPTQPLQLSQSFPATSQALSLPQASTQNAAGILASLIQQPAAPSAVQNAHYSYQPVAPQAAAPALVPGLTPDQANALASVIPPHVANNPEALAQHLKILQQLAEMGVPVEQWPLVFQALQNQQNGAVQQGASSAMPTAPAPRARSRSPDRGGYGGYNGQSYRSRSPLSGASPSLQADTIMLPEPTAKWTDYDAALPPGHIKVLSRTLFVGGVACTEEELRRIFSRFGRVQTCIANGDKRHAFVKMCTRAEALAARDGTQAIRDNDVFSKIRSVRWGVGFGPRDCSDYSTGISIIPLERLTDADRKWVLTAEYGGTGGQPVTPGLVMEEPDIEIGAGVSSKAISARRGGPDRSRNNDRSNSGRGHETDSPQAPSRHTRRNDSGQFKPEPFVLGGPPGTGASSQYGAPPGLGVPPAVPGFGFALPGAFSGRQ